MADLRFLSQQIHNFSGFALLKSNEPVVFVQNQCPGPIETDRALRKYTVFVPRVFDPYVILIDLASLCRRPPGGRQGGANTAKTGRNQPQKAQNTLEQKIKTTCTTKVFFINRMSKHE